MTNRDKLNALDNYELSFIFYHKIVPTVGMNYSETIGGVGDWLGEEASEEMWNSWKQSCGFYFGSGNSSR